MGSSREEEVGIWNREVDGNGSHSMSDMRDSNVWGDISGAVNGLTGVGDV